MQTKDWHQSLDLTHSKKKKKKQIRAYFKMFTYFFNMTFIVGLKKIDAFTEKNVHSLKLADQTVFVVCFLLVLPSRPSCCWSQSLAMLYGLFWSHSRCGHTLRTVLLTAVVALYNSYLKQRKVLFLLLHVTFYDVSPTPSRFKNSRKVLFSNIYVPNI